MKTLFKVLAFAVLLTAFSALTFAQEPTLADLFEKFKLQAKAKCGERDEALVTGKLIVEKFGSDELNKDVIDFVKKRMAAIEKEDPRCKLNKRYDADFTAKNWAAFIADSKEIMAAEGDSPLALDVMLTLVSVGYDRAAVDKIDTFNADTYSYAKMALQKIEGGKTSQTGKWGVFAPFTTKENAQSWMNFIIGYQMYYKLNQKTEALPFLFKSTQIGTEKKGDTVIYTNIGAYYYDEAVKLDTEYREKRKANNNQDNDETKALLALGRGTADRSSDAFGRAYKIALADPKLPAPYKTTLATKLIDLYKFRFNTADAKQADVDKYIADLIAKPMPDPSTAVTPVVEEVKPPTTTPPTTPTTTPPTTKPTTPTTKPTTTKPTTSSTTTTNGTTEATTKTPVKKPVTKKKGTR